MDYIRTDTAGQLVFEHSSEYLLIPSCLYGFHNNETIARTSKSGRSVFVHYGSLDIPTEERLCEHCGGRMHINDHPDITLQHLPIGGHLSVLRMPHNQLRCPHCGATKGQYISGSITFSMWLKYQTLVVRGYVLKVLPFDRGELWLPLIAQKHWGARLSRPPQVRRSRRLDSLVTLCKCSI